uniref:Uncharacterized protein n=1 Tax=Megaselia scalaris TaxID=36166 RepID=T1GGT9_MEGSC
MNGKYNKIEDSFASGTFYYKQKPQMLLEDRSYNRLHNEKSMESIVMQTMHSSPHHVVHPTRSHPHAMKAFQVTHGSSNLLNLSGSPLLSTKSQV